MMKRILVHIYTCFQVCMIVHRCACAVKYHAQGRDKEGRHQVTSGMEAGIVGT